MLNLIEFDILIMIYYVYMQLSSHSIWILTPEGWIPTRGRWAKIHQEAADGGFIS